MTDKKKDRPLVFVRCMTFNHEAYIEDALNGFVIQQTTFPFVVAIINDASTDKTKSVINEFVENNCIHNPEIDLRIEEYGTVLDVIVKDNPHCIFHIVHLNENHYGKKSKLPYFAKYENAAKYVAMCEGDDYWTDPLKLQKQVDFLEANPEYSMCFHGAHLKNELEYEEKYDCTDIDERDYTDIELFTHWIVPTASIVYRKDIVRAYPIIHGEWMITGDVRLVAVCATVGKVRGFSDRMCIYRINAASLVHSEQYAQNKIMKHPEHFLSFYYSFPNLRNEVRWCLSHAYYVRFRHGKTNLTKKIFDIARSIYYQPSFITNKIKNLIRRKQ